jgi:hypothetical protein
MIAASFFLKASEPVTLPFSSPVAWRPCAS